MGMAMSCVQCQDLWREISIDDYLDELKTWTVIPGTDFFPESFCPVCRPIAVETPAAIEAVPGHDLLQDSSVHCRCGFEYSPIVPSTVTGVKVDWKQINRDYIRHKADVVKGTA